MRRGAKNKWRLLLDALRECFDVDPAAIGSRDNTRNHIEAILHELAHAVVLGFGFNRDVAERVGGHFIGLTARQRHRIAALSECRALAVERLVLTRLGLRVDWRAIITSASNDMDVLCEKGAQHPLGGRAAVVRYIQQFQQTSTAERRANRIWRLLERMRR